jgi:hypothetical protein
MRITVILVSKLIEVDNYLKTHLDEDETAQRLLTLPGVGPGNGQPVSHTSG